MPPTHIDPAALDSCLATAIEQHDLPGVVASVVTRDTTLYEGAFGLRDVAGATAMTTDTIFRIASMTKPVTSVAVQMLIEAGELALDDPISRYLPAFADKPVIADFDAESGRYTTRSAKREITVRHLLTHTSGIGYGFCNEVLARLAEGAGPATTVQNLPLVADPGSRWVYGEGTRVLGDLVETVTRTPLDVFFAERIFTPLGMADTGYAVPADARSRVVTVHARTDEGLVETPNADTVDWPVQGDGGLNSTAADYGRFMQLFLNGGLAPDGSRLLSEASVTAMSANHIGDVRVATQPAAIPALARPFPLGAGRDTFGLGFQITGRHDDGAHRRPGSLSWAGIFNTQFWIDPAAGIAAVVLMQYLPFYDDHAITTLQSFERRVYETLG